MNDHVRSQLLLVFQHVFGVDSVDDSMSVETLDEWDSLSHINLILELESEFGVSISTDEAIEIMSLPAVMALVKAKTKHQSE